MVHFITAPLDEGIIADGGGWIFEQRKHAAAFERFWNFEAEEFHQRAAEVDVRDEAGGTDVDGRVTGPHGEERDVSDFVVHRGALVGEAVGFEKDSVVAGVEEQCAGGTILSGIEDAADLGIDEGMRAKELRTGDWRRDAIHVGRCPHALFLRFVGEIIAGIQIHGEDKVLVHLCIFDGA